ncbi:hypothetical protein F66182_15908, partial [Fusarium sp. NRRL 66182]
MAKKSKSKSDKSEDTKSNGAVAAVSTTLKTDAPVDPLLASLFEKSAGPVKAPTIQYKEFVPQPKPQAEATELEDGEEDSQDDDGSDIDMEDADQSDEDGQSLSEKEQPTEVQTSRKRKRGAADNLEDVYMEKLAREEEREKSRRKTKKSKAGGEDEDEGAESNASAESEEENSANSDDDDADDAPPPVHETVSGTAEARELDKSNRTVFLGNVSNTAITSKSDKKAL